MFVFGIKLYVYDISKNPILICIDVNNVKPSRKIRRSAFLVCNLGATTCVLHRAILSVLDPRKCEYLKDYSLDFEHACMTTYLAS